jgi:hypothetical protein
MTKLNGKIRPMRVCHPPHMPRYRMTKRDRITQLLNTVRHKLGAEVFRCTGLPATKPAGWFKQRKTAKKAITRASGNKLILIDNGFSTKRRLWFYHRSCGNNIFVTYEHIQQVGPERVCPYCQEAEDLKACGTINLLQKFVYSSSNQNAIVTLSQDLNSDLHEYAFYCLLHHEPYMANFKSYLESASRTNGCPRCIAEGASRD